MSFSDLMSSSRGPGVIGMIMALMVLLGFGLLFMFAFDDGLQGGEQTISSLITQQAREITEHGNSVTAGRKSLAEVPAKLDCIKQLTRSKRECEALQTKTTDLVAAVATRKAELVGTTEGFEAYKDKFRTHVRSNAKGETMDQLETLTGVTYTKVEIRDVTAVGIQIRHAGGQKRISFEDLSDSIRDRFQFDPKQKEQALAQESATRDQHEAAVAVADGIAGKQLDKQRAVDAVKVKDNNRQVIVMKEIQAKSLEQEIAGLNAELDQAGAAAAAARAAGRMHLNKSNTISGTIRAKQNRLSALRLEISRLQAVL